LKTKSFPSKELTFFYFFLSISLFGLGYTFFNNVENHLDSQSDAAFYLALVTNDFNFDDGTHRNGRLAVLKIVSIVHGWIEGHLGSWDSLKFSFFAVNALLMITAVAAFHKTLQIFGYPETLIRVAAIIHISSFASVNYFLRGAVDLGETVCLAALTLLLVSNQIRKIPLIFALGAFNRETFLAVGTALFFADILYEYYWEKKSLKALWPKLICFVLSVFTAVAVHVGVNIYVTGVAITPIETFNKLNDLPEWGSSRSLLEEVRRFLYVFLIPIVCIFFSPVKLPKRLVIQILFMCTVILFGSWIVSTSGTGLSRYLYSATGFYFSLMIASYICRIDSVGIGGIK
jgi:hypothetical protein